MLEQTRPPPERRARGLVSSRISGKRIDAQTFAPSPELRPLIEYHWSTRWDLREQTPHLTELLADPCIHIAFEHQRSRLVGVNTRLFRRELVDQGLIRAVKFRAGAAKALLPRRSIASMNNHLVAFSSLFDAPQLEARVLACEEDHDAITLIEQWITQQCTHPIDPKLGLVVSIVEQIAKDASLLTVQQIAKRAGFSLRPLQRLFREYVGVSPKWIVRRFRLQEAAARLELEGAGALSSLAATLGYSDHAHFSRDFKAATGRSPSVFSRTVWK